MFFAEVEPLDRLSSTRLSLRAPRRSDADSMHEATLESLDELVRWLPWAHTSHRPSDTRRFIRGARALRSRRQSFDFIIEERKTQCFLGMISLHRIDWIRRQAGMGYWIRKSAWGQGIATEAGGLVLDAAFQIGLHRIEVHVATTNGASQRVAQKLGLHREGVARGSELVNGAYLDHVQYSLLRTDPEDLER